MKPPTIRALRTNFPSPDKIEHPRDWERSHWSFNDRLRTKASRPSAVEQAKRLLQKLLAGAVGE